MKKLLLIIACIIGFIVILYISLPLIGLIVTGVNTESNTNDNITLFEQEGEIVSENSFEIFEVLDSGNALAYEMDDKTESRYLRVMFLNDGEKHFYNNQIIKVPLGKCLKQIGIYKDYNNTYPVVAIRDK